MSELEHVCGCSRASVCMCVYILWAIPLHPLLTTWFYLTPGTDNGKFSVALGQTFSALLPWYRCLNPTKVGPGTDIYCFTIQGQTFTALLPWDRWLSPTKADSGTADTSLSCTPWTDSLWTCPSWDKQSMGLFPLGHSLAEPDRLSTDSLLLFV